MFGLKVPVCQSIGSSEFDSINTILSNSSFSKPGNSWCPETDEKGNIFYVEIAEKCKQLKINNSHESSVDDVGYGTDNEVNNIHNIANQQITSPNGNLLSKGCHIANCRCNQNDNNLEFHRMDNLVQFKIPIKHVNIAKILGDTPKPHSYVGRILCKDLFGIIPGHFRSSKCSNQRLCIRGLDPTRDILKKKHIQIGDCLRLVNGQEITWNNIDEVFTRLCPSSEVGTLYENLIILMKYSPGCVQLQRLCSSSEVGTLYEDIIILMKYSPGCVHLQRLCSSSEVGTLYEDIIILMKYSPDCVHLQRFIKYLNTWMKGKLVASFVVQQVSKKSSKPNHHQVLKKTITKDSGIVQLLPKQENITLGKQWAENLHAVMYVDLEKLNSENNNKDEDLFSLAEISPSSTNKSTFMYNNKLMNASYHKEENNLLIVIFQQDRIHPLLLPKVVQNLIRVLRVQYNSLHEAFSHQDNHPSLSALLSSVLHQMDTSILSVDVDQCSSCSNTVQYLHLDSIFNDSIDRLVTGWEAPDCKEMSESYYGCRRTYTVLGSCLFYKDSLVCNHLPHDDLLDIYLYLKYQHIMSVCCRETVQTTVIWREIFPTRQFYNLPEEEPFGYTEPVSARWVWLFVAYKHTILCSMLETNGYHTRPDVILDPDPFLIDQAKATLMQIFNLNMYKQMDHCSKQNTSSLVTHLSETTQKPTSLQNEVVKNNMFNRHRKSARFHRDSSVRSSASSDSGSSVDSGNKKTSLCYHSTERNDVKLSVGIENCMLHYLHVDKHEGVYIKSDSGEMDSKILHNFSLACSRIKYIFDRYRFKKKASDQGTENNHMLPVRQDPTFRNVREEGVLFNIASQESPISYWVVGRQRSLTESYVCFKDCTPQSTVELAFKIAFGIKPG
ncbi:INTU [Mytilus coruscus]|uniref:INTU n=1 Tax=Mytilus coruscus TaxID=42192 RepID=A0A6J8E384_MYTCO|nr:INTU [Mytilus coruscus]